MRVAGSDGPVSVAAASRRAPCRRVFATRCPTRSNGAIDRLGRTGSMRRRSIDASVECTANTSSRCPMRCVRVSSTVVRASSGGRSSSRTFAQIGMVRRETRTPPEIFFRCLQRPRRRPVATATHRCDRAIEHAEAAKRFRKPLKKSSLRKACWRCGEFATVVVVVGDAASNGEGDDAMPTCLKKK